MQRRFFTYVMDNENIEATVSNVLESFGNTAKVFHILVRNLRWKTDYLFDIKVVPENNKLLIDDVKKINNKVPNNR